MKLVWRRMAALLALVLSSAEMGCPVARAAEPAATKPVYLDPSQSFEARTRDLMSRLTLEGSQRPHRSN